MDSVIASVVNSNGVVHAGDERPVPWWGFTHTLLAAAALVLVRRRKLQLDEDIRWRSFTLRQLLQHQSGLPDYTLLPDYEAAVAAGEDPWSAFELLQRLPLRQLQFAPGTRTSVSNLGYLYVRNLVEESTGSFIDDALKQLVFEPLGIRGPSLARARRDLEATAWGNPGDYHPGWQYHGLVVGSAVDAATLMHRLLAGELLPEYLLSDMMAPQDVLRPHAGSPWQHHGYGLGLLYGHGEPGGVYVGNAGAGPTSSAAVYQHAGASGSALPPHTAAVFAPWSDVDKLERIAMTTAAEAMQPVPA